MSNCVIRQAKSEDCEQIADLIKVRVYTPPVHYKLTVYMTCVLMRVIR